MLARRAAACVVVAAWTAHAVAQVQRVEGSRDAGVVVADAVLGVLPGPLATAMAEHRAEFHRVVTARPETLTDHPAMATADWWYVKLDIAAADKHMASRREAAVAFPRDQDAAAAMLKRSGQRHAGALPWVVLGQYDRLKQAFATGDASNAAHEAAVMTKLVVQATLPFHTTSAATLGDIAGDAPGDSSVSAAIPQMSGRQLQNVLLSLLHDQLAHEVRVWPGRFSPVTDPADALFSLLLEAHADLPALSACGAMFGEPSARLQTVAYEGRDGALSAAAVVLERRLESAALLSANLIGSAWIQAGRPDFATAHDAPADPTSRESVAPSATPADKVVGSASSRIYHRPDCPHAKRIKESNRVEFDSPRAAEEAGRRPCSRCCGGSS